MADLIHNEVIGISDGPWEGIYRILFDVPQINRTFVVRLDKKPAASSNAAKKRLSTKTPKKPPLPLIGDIIVADRSEFAHLAAVGKLRTVVMERMHRELSAADSEKFRKRTEVMAEFLDFDKLRVVVLSEVGLGSLVRSAIASHAVSKSLIYKLWSLLCRFGFTHDSLKPRHDRCGGPGVARPCDPNGRQKAGRKTNRERLARFTETISEPTQPGMSTEWRQWIMIADRKIPTPKPSFPMRYKMILNSQFVKRFRQENSALIPLELEQGQYPNRSQVRRVLEEVPRLQRLLESTTKGHYARSLRGMTGRNWKGVAGPGHTWAIDSTIGDIYLRSSINRAWIIGRPVVYIIVDYWSTAIVGFYVCLTGPSWDTAKVSLFSAATDPQSLADLWQYEPIQSLSPTPTLPSTLMCDRGEYLSRAASLTGVKLIPCLSYAPPYRPDLKGLVEVLHRIAKDRQYSWVPGAIDARRKEYELRRFDPREAVLTIREYTEYLHTIFAEYNLTANRIDRVDTHMSAAGVFPSPAGLWRWGHEIGIGTRRSFPQSELVSSLLPQQAGRVTRAGVRFCGMHYESEIVTQQNWTAHSRNFGSWEIDVHHFPGSVSRIWTPNQTAPGLIELSLSQQTIASREQTFDEVLDAFMFQKISTAEVEHTRVLQSMKSHQRVEALIAGAQSLTGDAIARHRGLAPTMTESRAMEVTPGEAALADHPAAISPSIDEANATYLQMMKSAYAAANTDGNS